MVKALVLTAITGTQIGRRYTVSERVNTIGSGPQCDVVLNDRHLSTRHAEIRQILDRWFIVPLAPGDISLNGLPVRGQSRLNPGDQLTLGGTTYLILYEELEERALGVTSNTQTGSVQRLGEYFVRRNILTPEQVAQVVQRQCNISSSDVRLPFGQIAYEMGLISRTQLEQALNEQRADFQTNFHD
jgi:pSer/pThr/pTyr-binding forkhead associated (FHA) protein